MSSAYGTVAKLLEKYVERHDKMVVDNGSPGFHLSKRSESARSKPGIQNVVVAAFLNNYASRNGLECAKGRGSKDESLLRLLPSDTANTAVHLVYENEWAETLTGLRMMVPHEVPSSVVQLSKSCQ